MATRRMMGLVIEYWNFSLHRGDSLHVLNFMAFCVRRLNVLSVVQYVTCCDGFK